MAKKIKRKRYKPVNLKGWPLSKEEWAIIRLGSSKSDSYAKYIARERKRFKRK